MSDLNLHLTAFCCLICLGHLLGYFCKFLRTQQQQIPLFTSIIDMVKVLRQIQKKLNLAKLFVWCKSYAFTPLKLAPECQLLCSDATSIAFFTSPDMAVQNCIGDSFRGATWVALHNGGGVGWGEVINGGFGLVLDGTKEAEDKAQSMLGWDVNNGVSYFLISRKSSI